MRDSRSDCFFLTWEWLDAWWTHLAGDLSLHIVLVRDGDESSGSRRWRGRARRLPWLSRLEFLGTGFAGSDYLDIIVQRGRELESAQVIADALQASSVALHLDHLPPGSVAESRLSIASSPNAAGRRCTRRRASVRSSRSKGTRGIRIWPASALRIAPMSGGGCAALEREFDVRFARVSDDEARREGLEALMSFHDERWGTRGGSTAFPTTASARSTTTSTHRALETGWLRLYELRLNDDVAAAMYGFSYNGRVLFLSARIRRPLSAAQRWWWLMASTIRAAIEEGAREFDMLFGVEAYKWFWATTTPARDRIDLFPSAPWRPTSSADRRGRTHRAHAGAPHLPEDSHAPQTRCPLALASKDAMASAISRARGAHHLGAAPGNGVPLILGYHRVVEDFGGRATTEMPSMLISRAMFERHIEWVGRQFRFVTLDDIGERGVSGQPFDGSGRRHYVRRWLSAMCMRTRFRCCGAKGFPRPYSSSPISSASSAWQTHDSSIT